jgi:ABC-type phosphate/phosphonate transport system substrate-binding protein
MGIVAIHAVRAIAFVILCFFAGTSAAEKGTDHGNDENNSLVVGYSRQVFYNVDPNDVMGLTKVWAQIVDHKMDNGRETRVLLFSTLAEAESALKNAEVDVVVLIPEEFLSLRQRVPIAAVMSADYGKHFYNELLLLVRNDRGISQVAQLRDKRLRIESGQKGSVPIQWLDTFLMSMVSTDAGRFFSTISEFPSAAQVILPVFFGQADACLASRSSFETMAELNPQISRCMRVLGKSPGFVTGIIAIRRDIRNERRDALLKVLLQMQNDPKGKQLLNLFRINRLVEFRPEHLTSIEKVLKEHRCGTEKATRRIR